MAAQDQQVDYYSPPAGGSTNPPPVVPEVSQPAGEAGPPATMPPPTGGRRFSFFVRRLPLKAILIAAGTLILVALLILGIKAFFGREKTPSQINLTYWSFWEDAQTVNNLISQFEAQNPGVKITYIPQSKQDYRDRLQNSLAKSAGPDIFRFHATWVPMLKLNLASLPSEVMSAATFRETFYPMASRDLEYNGQLVGIPLMYDGLALYINEDIFAGSGETPPETWDELGRTARELTVRSKTGAIEQAGVAMGRADNVDHWQDILALMMLQNRANLANPTGQLAEGTLSYFAAFTREDKVWDATLPPSTAAFEAGKLAMYFGPASRTSEIKTRNPNLKFKVVPMPQLPKNNPQEPDINWASYWVEGVSNKSQYQDQAFRFLQFMSEKTSLQTLYQGIMGAAGVGFVYPRTDMASLLSADPLLGAYVAEAPTAVSWYLASSTNDGQGGINSKLATLFASAVSGVVDERKTAKETLGEIAPQVAEVLSNYGVSEK